MRTLPAISLLLVPAASALEAQPELRFEGQSYAYGLELMGIPACPTLLDSLYSMDTMRRLTSFVDRVEMLDDTPGAQEVRVEISVLGFHTALVYARLMDRAEGSIVLRLLRQEGHLPIVSFPTSFEADYQVLSEVEGTRLRYTQEATMAHAATLPHQLFVRAQMRIFEHRLRDVVAETCP